MAFDRFPFIYPFIYEPLQILSHPPVLPIASKTALASDQQGLSIKQKN
jgi:hypothetical protein